MTNEVTSFPKGKLLFEQVGPDRVLDSLFRNACLGYCGEEFHPAIRLKNILNDTDCTIEYLMPSGHIITCSNTTTRIYDKFNGLSFAALREINVARCQESFHQLDRWNPAEWGCALAGEVGELCNFLKKRLRGDGLYDYDIAKELADVITYADLLAASLNIDLGQAVIEKFNEVSKRIGSERRL